MIVRNSIVVFVEMDVGAIGLASAAQSQNFRQSRSTLNPLFEIRRMPARRDSGSLPYFGRNRPCAIVVYTAIFPESCLDQITDGVGFGNHAVGQAHATGLAQAQHQLHAFEAAEAELAFEVSRGAARRLVLRARVNHQVRQAAGAQPLAPAPRRSECDRVLFPVCALLRPTRLSDGEAERMTISNRPDRRPTTRVRGYHCGFDASTG